MSIVRIHKLLLQQVAVVQNDENDRSNEGTMKCDGAIIPNLADYLVLDTFLKNAQDIRILLFHGIRRMEPRSDPSLKAQLPQLGRQIHYSKPFKVG